MGHLVELPFTPVATSIRHAMLPRGSPQVYMGGGSNRARTGHAQAKATNAYTSFLEEKLKLWFMIILEITLSINANLRAGVQELKQLKSLKSSKKG